MCHTCCLAQPWADHLAQWFVSVNLNIALHRRSISWPQLWISKRSLSCFFSDAAPFSASCVHVSARDHTQVVLSIGGAYLAAHSLAYTQTWLLGKMLLPALFFPFKANHTAQASYLLVHALNCLLTETTRQWCECWCSQCLKPHLCPRHTLILFFFVKLSFSWRSWHHRQPLAAICLFFIFFVFFHRPRVPILTTDVYFVDHWTNRLLSSLAPPIYPPCTGWLSYLLHSPVCVIALTSQFMALSAVSRCLWSEYKTGRQFGLNLFFIFTRIQFLAFELRSFRALNRRTQESDTYVWNRVQPVQVVLITTTATVL